MNFQKFLPTLEPRERGRFYLAALAFMFAATSALVARTLGDSLFLSLLGSDPLPFMYIAGAVLTGFGAYACSRVSRSISTAKLGILVALFLISANLAVYLALDLLPAASRSSAYLLADLTGRILILLYWAYISEIFDARQARRLFGLLGAAGTAACLPAGLLVGPVAARFGTASLILVVCALMTGFILTLRALQRREIHDSTSLDRRTLVAANSHSAVQLHRNRQFITIAALAIVTAIVQTLVDYQFKASFTSLATGAGLVRIFGDLYAFTSIVALILQLFFVHRILQRGGIYLSLCALPAALLLTSAGVLRTASAGWLYASKALDITLTLTVNGTSRQMLYRGIRRESRFQARALAEGIYQPLAVGFAGAALALAVGFLSIRAAAGIILAGCLLWLFLTRKAYTSYLSGLLSSLRGRRFEADDEPFAVQEAAVQSYVQESLVSGPDDDVIYLAGVLPYFGGLTGTDALRSALERENPEVKVAVLDYLRNSGVKDELDSILPLAGHPDAEVRRAATRSAAACETNTSIQWLQHRLADGDPMVRSAAAAGLVNSTETRFADSGLTTLEKMINSGSTIDRKAAAEGLSDIHHGNITHMLAQLLNETDVDVLKSTLEACRSHPDPSLADRVLPLLGIKPLSIAASDALVAMGKAALEPVRLFLRTANPTEHTEIIRKLATALAVTGEAEALLLLRKMLHLVSPEDQEPIFLAFGALVSRQPTPAQFMREIDELLSEECHEAGARLESIRALGSASSTQLLRDALGDLMRCHLRHAFILLDAQIEGIDMIALHSKLTTGPGERRSQALEFLNNVLPEKVKGSILGLVGESALNSAKDVRDPSPAVANLLELPDSDWVAIGALHAAAQLKVRSRFREIRGFLSHDNPIVRETALSVLSQLEERSAFLAACVPLTTDPDMVVRELAISLSHSG
jgi:ATP/ADP translocase/HEAT repeat protein